MGWRRTTFLAVLACAALTTSRASAVDPFEIQVYDGTANPKGSLGLEAHLNSVIRGTKTADAPELPQNHQSHFTLEPSYGLFSFWELGAYLQTAITGDGAFDYAGAKLRSKFVTPPKWNAHLRLGLNLELSLLPTAFDIDEWGTEFRPIVAWENERFEFVVNPIIGVPLAGPGWHEGPTFEPCAMALYKFGERVSIGFEYYGDIGPIADPLPIAKQQHYLYEVTNVLAVKSFELNIGFGEGLTSASNAFVAKVIVGYTWDFAKTKR